MYIETKKDGTIRKVNFEGMMKILNFYYFYYADQLEQKMRWNDKKVVTGGNNPKYFRTYEYKVDLC